MLILHFSYPEENFMIASDCT